MKHTNEIIRMAREAGFADGVAEIVGLEGFARLAALVAAAERNKLAQWMIDRSYATGHGDTTEDLLEELDWQITESWSKVVMTSVEAEREACAKVCDQKVDAEYATGKVDHNEMGWTQACAIAIRARGQA